MIAIIIVAVLGLLFFAVAAIVFTGLLGIFATPTPPTRAEAAARVADKNRVLAETFDGRTNAAFVRKLWEPITEAMVMDAANVLGYRFVSKDNAAGTISYHFTKVRIDA